MNTLRQARLDMAFVDSIGIGIRICSDLQQQRSQLEAQAASPAVSVRGFCLVQYTCALRSTDPSLRFPCSVAADAAALNPRYLLDLVFQTLRHLTSASFYMDPSF